MPITWPDLTFPPINLLSVWKRETMTNKTTYGLTAGDITMSKTIAGSMEEELRRQQAEAQSDTVFKQDYPTAFVPPKDGRVRIRDIVPLKDVSMEDYYKLRDAGLLWVVYPEASGDFQEDCCGSTELF